MLFRSQQNLPATPVTDIRVTHKDLVLSTQGRSFWIMDDLTPLHQLNDKSISADAILFQPRQAVRTPARGFGGGAGGGVQFPAAGATIDYYLSSAPSEDITLEILDASGKLIRKFSSAGSAAAERGAAAEAAPPDEGEEGFRPRSGPTRLDKSAGMHRFTWDLRYPGPWAGANRPEGPNGPMAVPGKYMARLTVGSWTSTQSFTLIEIGRAHV